MDAIKKKMQQMKTEIEDNNKLINIFEKEMTENADIADKREIVVKNLSRKIQNLENDEEETLEKLIEANCKLEVICKSASDKEAEVGAFNRRVLLVEDEVNKTEAKLGKVIMELAVESKKADKLQRAVKSLEGKLLFSGEQVGDLEQERDAARAYQAEASRALQDIQRKYKALTTESTRADEKVEVCERQVEKLEEALENIGQNLKVLEVGAEKALKRDDAFKRQMQIILERVKETEIRADSGEKHIKMLHNRMDEVEDELIRWKSNVNKVAAEIDDTFVDMMGIRTGQGF